MRLPASQLPAGLAEGLAALEGELGVRAEFDADVLAEAERAVAEVDVPALDLTGLELVTIDPPGSRDLDQALFVERRGSGYRVHYAIADVASFVRPGGALDAETHRRGQTLYAPHRRIPLHPTVISEDAASLLPGQPRPAVVWQVDLDADGAFGSSSCRRALVRSREQLSYAEAQRRIDDGSASDSLRLLREVGLLREEQERSRGGVSLPIPEQEVRVGTSGAWELGYRSPLPVEGWNAQVSLLTGMVAAEMMLYAEVGVLRTLPPAENAGLARLRRTSQALGIRWPGEMDYPEFVRGLDPAEPAHAAMLRACTTLFRGAGYVAFSGSVPTTVAHAAIAAEYAHTTAPLRRLVDRYVLATCLALCADEPVPSWVLRALDGLPEVMAGTGRRAGAYERRIIDLTEALVLAPRVGETFTGVVVDVDEHEPGEPVRRGRLVVAEPAVEGAVTGDGLRLGAETTVRLVEADVERALVRFETARPCGERDTATKEAR
ncbi:RNB domain-containing ribonuclease [Desertihabitans aurantiacus]|uniref:RNB domain-containing ribonuclease n=1 Tax=Desertihabitans aurantiacus TaxID=2282477 RepID=UPI001E4FFA6A|nr:RNB domain-containing ribonuclease [Desertihabitans aurantiacus]